MNAGGFGNGRFEFGWDMERGLFAERISRPVKEVEKRYGIGESYHLVVEVEGSESS
jgi:hypothetical protein